MECPHCRGEISLAPKQLGQTWTCPHCRRAFQSTRPERHDASAAGAGRRVVRCRSCFHKYFLSKDAAEKCPACGVASATPMYALGSTVAMGDGRTSSPYGVSPDVEISQMYGKLETIQRCLLISAILNIIAGTLWTLTLIGALFGVPLLVLAYFELRHRSRYGSMSPHEFARRTKRIAIVELVFSLGSAISLLTAIVNLVLSGQVETICDRYGLKDQEASARQAPGSSPVQAGTA